MFGFNVMVYEDGVQMVLFREPQVPDDVLEATADILAQVEFGTLQQATDEMLRISKMGVKDFLIEAYRKQFGVDHLPGA